MIRFLTFLLGREYEECKSCQTLKEQLHFEREEKKRLTDTLLNILNPKAVEAPPVELNPIQQTSALFSRRRAALEEKDRQEAKILKERKFIGVPDNKVTSSVEVLEHQLGIPSEPAEKEVS